MTTLVFHVVIGLKAASVIAFSNVNLFFTAVVVGYFDVDLCISITTVRISMTARNVSISLSTINWIWTWGDTE